MLLLAVGLSALTGCGSFPDTAEAMRQRLAGRDETRARAYDAPQRATYEALRTAAGRMGYRFVRGGAAQGEFEAVSGLGRGEDIGTARQLVIRAWLEPNPEGGTQLTVRISEIIESDSSNHPGMASETPLRDTPQYEVLFRTVDEVLKGVR